MDGEMHHDGGDATRSWGRRSWPKVCKLSHCERQKFIAGRIQASRARYRAPVKTQWPEDERRKCGAVVFLCCLFVYLDTRYSLYGVVDHVSMTYDPAIQIKLASISPGRGY